MSSKKITSISELNQYLTELSVAKATAGLLAIKGPARRDAIALFAPSLTEVQRSKAINMVAERLSKEYGLKLHVSDKATPSTGMRQMCFTDDKANPVARSAVSALSYVTAPLKLTTSEAAEEWVAKQAAKRAFLSGTASSADKVSAVIKAYKKLSGPEKRSFIAALKSV